MTHDSCAPSSRRNGLTSLPLEEAPLSFLCIFLFIMSDTHTEVTNSTTFECAAQGHRARWDVPVCPTSVVHSALDAQCITVAMVPRPVPFGVWGGSRHGGCCLGGTVDSAPAGQVPKSKPPPGKATPSPSSLPSRVSEVSHPRPSVVCGHVLALRPGHGHSPTWGLWAQQDPGSLGARAGPGQVCPHPTLPLLQASVGSEKLFAPAADKGKGTQGPGLPPVAAGARLGPAME